MLHTQLAAFALAAATLAASGCGGSSKTTSTATAASTSSAASTSTTSASSTAEPSNALTSAQLIAKTDAICAHITAKRSSTKLENRKDYARLVPPLGAYEQAQAARLSKLTPPASMAGEWKQIATGIETVANDTAKIGQDILSGKDSEGAVLLTTTTKVLTQTNALAKRAGFTSCAKF